jgi:hypothetical protein
LTGRRRWRRDWLYSSCRMLLSKIWISIWISQCPDIVVIAAPFDWWSKLNARKRVPKLDTRQKRRLA